MAKVDLTGELLHTNDETSFSQIGETQLEVLRQLAAMFQSHLNKPGSPPRVEQTSPELSAGEISPPRVDTPASPSVKKRVNEPSPKEGKHKTPAPTMSSAQKNSGPERIETI